MNSGHIIVGAGLGLAAIIAYNALGSAPVRPPRYEISPIPFSSYPDHPGHHWRIPPREYRSLGLKPSRHHYPRKTGTNITMLINHGFDAMRLPAPVDDAWRECPPSVVMY